MQTVRTSTNWPLCFVAIARNAEPETHAKSGPPQPEHKLSTLRRGAPKARWRARVCHRGCTVNARGEK
eukprot:11177628-Lingulodinium_polyedra.AAC.1